MKILNQRAHYLFTYGDKNTDEVRLSDYAVELMKTKRFQSHGTTMFFALLALGSYAQPSSAIPPEYGEAQMKFLIKQLKMVWQVKFWQRHLLVG